MNGVVLTNLVKPVLVFMNLVMPGVVIVNFGDECCGVYKLGDVW